MAKINEETEVTVPLKNLIGLVVVTAIAVWAYFGLVQRISFLEHKYEMVSMDTHKVRILESDVLILQIELERLAEEIVVERQPRNPVERFERQKQHSAHKKELDN